MSLTSRRGSAVIELALSSVLYAMIIGFIGQMSILTLSHLWADHILYEALICTESHKKVAPCQKDAEAKLKKLSWTKTKPTLSIQQMAQNSIPYWTGTLRWTPYGFGSQKISQSSQRLALKLGASR
jgi:hypothetical protein